MLPSTAEGAVRQDDLDSCDAGGIGRFGLAFPGAIAIGSAAIGVVCAIPALPTSNDADRNTHAAAAVAWRRLTNPARVNTALQKGLVFDSQDPRMSLHRSIFKMMSCA
jgi:hypothetical protein